MTCVRTAVNAFFVHTSTVYDFLLGDRYEVREQGVSFSVATAAAPAFFFFWEKNGQLWNVRKIYLFLILSCFLSFSSFFFTLKFLLFPSSLLFLLLPRSAVQSSLLVRVKYGLASSSSQPDRASSSTSSLPAKDDFPRGKLADQTM